MYYLNCGFKITILHVDRKFAPLQSFIQEMSWKAQVDLSSSIENVTEIERQIIVAKERIKYIRHILPFN